MTANAKCVCVCVCVCVCMCVHQSTTPRQKFTKQFRSNIPHRGHELSPCRKRWKIAGNDEVKAIGRYKSQPSQRRVTYRTF